MAVNIFSKRSSRPSPSFQSKFYTLLALPFPDQPRLARRELNRGGGVVGSSPFKAGSRAGAFSISSPLPDTPGKQLPRFTQRPITNL